MAISARASIVFVFLGSLTCGPHPTGDGDTSTSHVSEDVTAGSVPTSEVMSSETSSETPCEDLGEDSGEDCSVANPECSLDYQVCALGVDKFRDCGSVHLIDDVALWQAAHDCVLEAMSKKQIFKMVAEVFIFDSLQAQAYVAYGSCPRIKKTVLFDSDPCGGGGCGPVVTVSSCSGFSDDLGCAVEAGKLCLVCDDEGESTKVCGPG